MIRRAFEIACAMRPPQALVIKSTARLLIAGCVISLARLMPAGYVAEWTTFAGKVFLMFTIFGLIGHAEEVFMRHVVCKVENELSRAKAAVLVLAGVLVVAMRRPYNGS